MTIEAAAKRPSASWAQVGGLALGTVAGGAVGVAAARSLATGSPLSRLLAPSAILAFGAAGTGIAVAATGIDKTTGVPPGRLTAAAFTGVTGAMIGGLAGGFLGLSVADRLSDFNRGALIGAVVVGGGLGVLKLALSSD